MLVLYVLDEDDSVSDAQSIETVNQPLHFEDDSIQRIYFDQDGRPNDGLDESSRWFWVVEFLLDFTGRPHVVFKFVEDTVPPVNVERLASTMKTHRFLVLQSHMTA